MWDSPHDLKGEGIYAYVTLMQGDNKEAEKLREELIAMVRKEIGPIAKPDAIQWAPGLPKALEQNYAQDLAQNCCKRIG